MAKGGKFELKIAKILSLWFSNGTRDDLVCRTDSSGGRATVRTAKNKKSNKYWYGDLRNSDDVAKSMFDNWSIECKTGYSRKNKKSITKWDILDVIDSSQKVTTFEEMWKQCERDAELSYREPILIFGRSLRSPCIAMNYNYFNRMAETVENMKSLIIMFDNELVIIFKLDWFLKNFSKNELFDKGE